MYSLQDWKLDSIFFIKSFLATITILRIFDTIFLFHKFQLAEIINIILSILLDDCTFFFIHLYIIYIKCLANSSIILFWLSKPIILITILFSSYSLIYFLLHHFHSSFSSLLYYFSLILLIFVPIIYLNGLPSSYKFS